MIHFVMLLITWSIDATASTWPAVPASAGCAAAVRAAAAARAVTAVRAASRARLAGARPGRRGVRPRRGGRGRGIVMACLLGCGRRAAGAGAARGRARGLTSLRRAGRPAGVSGCGGARPPGRPPPGREAGRRGTPALTEIRFPAVFFTPGHFRNLKEGRRGSPR